MCSQQDMLRNMGKVFSVTDTSAVTGEVYEYTIKLGELAVQEDIAADETYNLGQFTGMENGIQLYNHGDECPSEVLRSVTIGFRQGQVNELVSVSETTPCNYHAIFQFNCKGSYHFTFIL